MSPTLAPSRPSRSTARLVAVGVAVAALVAPVAAVAGVQIAQRSDASNATSAMLGSGVMKKYSDGFRPKQKVNRAELALSLHRSIPRLAVSTSVGSLAASSGFTEIAAIPFKVDGVTGKRQGVLVRLETQLDHDSALGTSCAATFQLTVGTPGTTVGFWSQELYAGSTGQEDNIAMSFFATQQTRTNATYHLLGANSCTQGLFTDGEILTVQSFPLNGAGRTPAVTPAATRPVAPRHDR